jgi:SPX domain protein involved in polyphosphate accumulation
MGTVNMKKHEKVDWLITAGLENHMTFDELLREVAIYMDNRDFDVFYDRLLRMHDLLGPNEFDNKFGTTS